MKGSGFRGLRPRVKGLGFKVTLSGLRVNIYRDGNLHVRLNAL